MRKLDLDTSILIGHWRKCRGRTLADKTEADAAAWANELIRAHGADAIVTPVRLEMVGGVTSRHELRLTRAFLGQFRCIDRGDIRRGDWEEALRLAQRVPRDKRRRDLGDCLIRAIANRLRHDVDTSDKGFPR